MSPQSKNRYNRKFLNEMMARAAIMSKRILQLILSVLLLKSMSYAQVNHNGDFQVWEYLSVEKDLVNSMSSRLIGVMRWGDDASRFLLRVWSVAAGL